MTHRVIMITGAARGIGRTIAEALAPDHDLSITYKTAAQDAAVFCQSHPNVLALQADLRPADLIQRSTDETALSRLAELDEVAQTVRFLLSQAASRMTGTILPVSAGFRL